MFKNIGELPKDVQAKLSEAQQTAFLEAYNASEAETESEKLRAGWEAAVKTNSRVVHHALLFQPGNWDAVGGDGKITDKMADDATFAIQRCEELGVPIALKYQHSDDDKAIPVGVVKNAVMEKGRMTYGDCYVLQDARADLDGTGSKILVTIDQMADALLTEGMNLSIEAFLDVKIPSYYGDKIISLEPSAVAILPPGVAPAVTKKLVAGRDSYKSVAIFAGKGSKERGTEMTLEELTALVEEIATRLETLEKSLAKKKEPGEDEETPETAELEKTIADQKVKLEAVETEKLEAEIAKLQAELDEKMLPGQAEKLTAELEKTADLSEKKVVLSRLNAIIEEPVDSERKLKAGREKSKSKQETFEASVKKEMNDNKVSRFVAQRTVLETMDDNEFDTKEV